MRSTLLGLIALTAAASLAFACGGNAPEPQPPTSTPSEDAGAPSTGAETPSASATTAATPPAADAGASTAETKPAEGGGFDSLSKDKKVDIMMSKVVPDVGKVFKEHDAKKYAKFTCKTCHGDAKEKSKDDPKKVLPKLTFSNGGMEKLEKTKGPMVKFMREKVLPTMANALGEKPYDPQTKQGFGCGGCHAIN
jgi:hypothetical protein